MGLSNFPSPAEGVLPVLVIYTLFSVTLLKNIVRSVLQVAGGNSTENSPNIEEDSDGYFADQQNINGRERRISITQFKSLYETSMIRSDNSSSSTNTQNIILMECCVCLCGFEAEEEVSELSCKHFFHKECLEKWFLNKDYATCPLCRS